MSSNIEEVVAASQSINPLEIKADNCVFCGDPIQMAAFKGTGFCCIDHIKAAGADVSSVGTVMFVTKDEREAIMMARNHRNMRLGVSKQPEKRKKS